MKFHTLRRSRRRGLAPRLRLRRFWRAGGGVGKLEGNVAFPFRLERGNVDDDAAAGVGGFAQTDGQDVARNAEIFDRARQCEGIGRDDAAVVFDGNEIFGSKFWDRRWCC